MIIHYIKMSRKVLIFVIIFFLGLMSVSITHAETYSLVTKWGSSGSGEGQFNSPTDIAVDSWGNVYVADTGNHRIQKFDSNGNYLTQWGSNVNGSGQLKGPVGVAVDSSANVYVADLYNIRDSQNYIKVFDSNGNYLKQIDTAVNFDYNPVSIVYYYDFPNSVAVDSLGNIYVFDCANWWQGYSYSLVMSRIEKFDSNGNFITQFDYRNRTNAYGYGGSAHIAVDFLGNIYVANGKYVKKFDSSGNYLMQWTSFSNATYTEFTDIAVDLSGNVYVSDRGNRYAPSALYQGNKNVQKFDSNGNFITQWGSMGRGDGQFYVPSGVAVDSSGNVYVADSNNNRIQKFAINPLLPVANFTSNVTQGPLPLTVKFTDRSKNATGWKWNFGDGSNSTDKNPTHTFSVAKNYTVTLTASNAKGTDSKLAKIIVSAQRLLPVANFTSNVTKGLAPLSVQFTDKSINATSWNWCFGDGNTSTKQNPVYTYSKAGYYTVSLSAINVNGTNTFNQSIIVNSTFLPNPNGYNFENFVSKEELSWDTFRETFGAANVENNDIAKEIYGYYSTIGSGGNCFGMSASCLLLYNSYNEPKAWSLTENTKPELDIIRPYRSSSVSDWIKYYQGTQISYDICQEKESYRTANQVFDTLYSKMSGENYWKDPMIISYSWWCEPYLDSNNDGYYNLGEIYFPLNFNGKIDYSGHAVVPYRIERLAKSGKVFVYDSRYPGDTNLYFYFDIEKNTVSPLINASTNKFCDGDNYHRINAYPMRLVSLSTIQKQQTRLPNLEYLRNYGTLLYTDGFGNNLGYISGEFKSDIPGAYNVQISGYDNISFPETYLLPETDLKRQISGLQDGIANITIFRPNYMIIAEVSVSEGSIDGLYTPPDASSVEFESGQETSSLSLMFEKEKSGVAQIVYANISQIEANGAVNLSMDNGSVVMKNTGLARTCTFKLEQAVTSPNSANINKSIVVEKDSTLFIKPRNWNDISNSQITIEHDVGSDGTIDSVQIVEPSNVSIHPVSNFTTNVTAGYAPLTVQFTDLSKNATSWEWDFGDETYSTEQNPLHTYTKEGNYTIVLNSSNSAGYDIEKKIDYVVITDWNPWNDPYSEGGESITLSELQEAIYNWRFGVAISNGQLVDLEGLQELIYNWRFG